MKFLRLNLIKQTGFRYQINRHLVLSFDPAAHWLGGPKGLGCLWTGHLWPIGHVRRRKGQDKHRGESGVPMVLFSTPRHHGWRSVRRVN